MAKGQPRSPGMHLDRHSVAFFDSMHTLFLIYMVRLPPRPHHGFCLLLVLIHALRGFGLPLGDSTLVSIHVKS